LVNGNVQVEELHFRNINRIVDLFLLAFIEKLGEL